MALPTSVDRLVVAEREGDVVTIRVGGTLDAVAGVALLDTLRAELDRGPTRIDIDLTALASFDDAGLEALAGCPDLATGLADGLHFRTDGGAGQDALLLGFGSGHPGRPSAS